MDVNQLITEHLDIWTAATEKKSSAGRGNGGGVSLYGIKKLKELIIELAMRGKLVPQDQREGDGGSLVEESLRRRNELIKNKTIKKPKTVKPMPSEFTGIETPKNWSMPQLGDLAYLITDGTHHTPKYQESGIAFISVKDIDGETVSFDDCKYISVQEHEAINQRCNPEKGDLLLCRIGTLGRATLVDTERPFSLFVSVGLIKSFQDLVLPEYLHVAMHSAFLLRQFDLIKAGGSHTNKLNLTDLPRLFVPLPPYAEQHRIVAKVKELMGLCDALEAQAEGSLKAHQTLVETCLATLTNSQTPEDLTQNWTRIETHFDTLFTTEEGISRLQDVIIQLGVMGRLRTTEPNDEPAITIFERIRQRAPKAKGQGKATKLRGQVSLDQTDGSSLELPVGWENAEFSQLIEPEKPISYGVLVPGNDTVGGVPFVRIADLSIDKPSDFPEKSISPKVDQQYARTRLEGGEILMGVVGSIGKLGVAPESWRGGNIARAVCRIVPAKEVSKEFVLLLLRSTMMQNRFRGDTRVLAQPTLNIGLIRSAPTPVPPFAEQLRIVQKVDQLLELCALLRGSIEHSDATSRLLSDTLTSKIH